ncbi:alginate lyase family protein [Tropicimonas marinistellae]|uniref:alginate lyase family protein n=1 Tax=Tropicimonas marinistellae TaxID=1739787 RepID=UPI000835937B|nr:alginate lyase family protein [Tropicimonas marinistellae]
MTRALAALFSLGLGAFAGDAAAASEMCRVRADPVVTLGFASRYKEDSESRSDIDPKGNAEVNAALKPVDDFIRDLSTEANQILIRPKSADRADCLVAELRRWADAGALGDLQTFTAQISVGGRFAGISLAYLQVRDTATRPQDVAAVDRWLGQAAREELRFWAEDATPGAQKGNLRAWSSLGVIATGIATGDGELVAQAAEVVEMLMCTATPDGGLPQEMRRGKYALHYQLHAIAPLVLSVSLLRTQDLDLSDACDAALHRIVEFAVSDLDTGARSEAYSGRQQSYFDGTETLRPHELAWADLYFTMSESAELERRVAPIRPLKNSKLGGNQDILIEHLLPAL